MNKKGFTISEAIITMGVIGIIAALTMPIFTAGYRKQVYAKSLSSIIGQLETAMGVLLTEEYTDNLRETVAWKNLGAKALDSSAQSAKSDVFVGDLINVFYLIYDADKDSASDYYTGLSVTKLSGDKIDLTKEDVFKDAVPFELKKGGTVFINILAFSKEVKLDKRDLLVLKKGGNLSKRAANIIIDVNGTDKPNTIGRDIFKFILGVDGKLYPDGSLDVAIFNGTDNAYKAPETLCNSTKDGYACAAYLMENNFKMDY